jgi:hypothetical protein
MLDPYMIDTTTLYIEECTAPYGTQICIDSLGKIHTYESSLSFESVKSEDEIFYGKASGEIPSEDWGIKWNEEKEVYETDFSEEVYEAEKLAFLAAVEKFGITAEIHDAIIDHFVGDNYEEKK